jgi:hypothetical protein
MKKMRAVVPAIPVVLFCSALLSFFWGPQRCFVWLFLIPLHIVVGFCMLGKSTLEFGQSSVGP